MEGDVGREERRAFGCELGQGGRLAGKDEAAGEAGGREGYGTWWRWRGE